MSTLWEITNKKSERTFESNDELGVVNYICKDFRRKFFRDNLEALKGR